VLFTKVGEIMPKDSCRVNFLELFFGRGFWKRLGAVRGEERSQKTYGCRGGYDATMDFFGFFVSTVGAFQNWGSVMHCYWASILSYGVELGFLCIIFVWFFKIILA
jgi:hypothetical protein